MVPGAAVVAVTFGLARYGYGLLLPDMTASLSLSPGTAGLISSGAYLSYLVANAGVVAITDRAGPRAAIGLACALAAAGMAVVAAANSAAILAVGVLVAGAAAGLAFPPYAEVVQRRVTRSRRDLAWSTINAGTGWGVAVAGPVAIVAGDRWRLAWLVFAGLAVATGVLGTLAAPGRDTDIRHRRPQLSWTWFFCPRSRPLLISAVLVGAGSSVWWAFSVGALRADGLGETPARIVYATCGVAGIAASAAGTVFARVGLRTGYLVTVVLLGASAAALTLAASGLGSALVAAAAFGVLYPTVIAAQGIWSSRVFASWASTTRAPRASCTSSRGFFALGVLINLGPRIGKYVKGHYGHHRGPQPPMTLLGLFRIFVGFFGFLMGCTSTGERLRDDLRAADDAVGVVFNTTRWASPAA